MASRFWVGGTGTWDASTTTHWASVSGGSSGASVPTSADTVTIDANSGSPTITLGANTAASPITVTGGSNTLTSAGFSVTSTITVNGASATLIFGDALNCTGTITLTSGTLNTAGQSVTAVAFSSNNSSTRTLTLGSSTISLSSTGTAWNTGTVSGLTVSANTALVILSGASTTFQSAQQNWNGMQVSFTGSGTPVFSSNGSTFASVTRTGTSVVTDGFQLSSAFTVTGTLTLTGNTAAKRLLVTSDTLATQRTITNTGATMAWSNVDFRDIALSSAYDASAITGGSGDCGGNSNNITFTASQVNYWKHGASASYNWSDSTRWFLSDHTTAGRVPLPQDDARFDAQSFSATAKTVNIDVPRLCRSMDWAGTVIADGNGAATNSPTLSYAVSFTWYGSMALISGMTLNVLAATTWEGRSSYTMTSAGKQFGQGWGSFTVQGVGGTLTLQDALTISANSVVILAGTFDAGTMSVTAPALFSTGTLTRLLKLGSGTWTLSGTSPITISGSGVTVTPGSSTLAFTNTTSSPSTLALGGFTYNNLSITGGGTGAVNFSGSNAFNTVTINAPKTVTFTAGTTQTISSLVATGTAGNIITITSSSPGSAFTLFKSSGRVICDYLSLKDSTATGGAGWFAGANSTSVSGNTGWSFTNPPPDVNASGLVTLHSLLSSAGTEKFIGTGSLTLHPVVHATANEVFSGAGVVRLSSHVAAAALERLVATGSIVLRGSVSGAAKEVMSGTGSILLSLDPSGTGVEQMGGTGLVVLDLGVDAQGFYFIVGFPTPSERVVTVPRAVRVITG